MELFEGQIPLIAQPPAFCEYSGGHCDQSFDGQLRSDAVFLYPSEPEIIAATIEESVRQLRMATGLRSWITWKEFGAAGQIIFCQICKALRFTKFAVADVTTLNFNLLFEIGYAIGLGLPVLPIRDTSYVKDSRVFAELGLVDTLGYFDFQNSADLVKEVSKGAPNQTLPQLLPVDTNRPIYVVKSPVQSEGMIRLMSSVKKS